MNTPYINHLKNSYGIEDTVTHIERPKWFVEHSCRSFTNISRYDTNLEISIDSPQVKFFQAGDSGERPMQGI